MKRETGLIKLILLIVVALLALSYYRVDLRALVESEQTAANFQYVWGLLTDVWAKMKELLF
jgi:hypothetical protein